jgi:hypothetical protein
MKVIVETVTITAEDFMRSSTAHAVGCTETGRPCQFWYYMLDEPLHALVERSVETGEPIELPENKGLIGDLFYAVTTP